MTRLLLVVALVGLAFWLIASWLISTLGWTLIVLIVLWGVVAISVLHAAGRVRLPPWWASWFDQITHVPAAPEPRPEPEPVPVRAAAAAPVAASRFTPRPANGRGTEQINDLHGLETAKAQLDWLLAMGTQARERGLPTFGVQAPATMLLFQGPSGTGKTETARAFVHALYDAGIIAHGHYVPLSSAEVSDQSPGQANLIVRDAAEAALGGVLLIEDASAIVRGMGRSDDRDAFAEEVARGLMHVINHHPGELVIIAIGQAGLRFKMSGHPVLRQELLNRIHVETVDFDELSTDSLVQVFMDHARAQAVRMHPELHTRLPAMIQSLKAKDGDRFANAHTIRHWFDEVSSSARRRSGHSGVTELTAQDFRLETA